MPWTEVRGQRIWVDPQTGLAQVRARRGGVMEVSPEGAVSAIESGEYSVATPEEAERYDYERNRTLAQDAQDALITAGRKSGDVLLAPGRLLARGTEAVAGAVGAAGVASEARFAAESMGGRALQEMAAEEGAMSRGEDPDAARQALQEQQARFAEDRPWLYTGASLAPEVAAAFAVPQGVGFRAAAIQGAAEGALYGGLQAEENAYMRGDSGAAVEDWITATATGAALGLGIGGAIGAAESRLGRVFGKAPEPEAVVEGAARAERSAYRQSGKPAAEEVAEAFSRATNEPIDPAVAAHFWNDRLAPILGKGSELASGADSAFVTDAVSATQKGAVIREISRNPDAVLDDAVSSVMRTGNAYEEAMDTITEVSRNMEVKASAWNSLVPSEMADEAVRLSRKRAASALTELETAEARIATDELLEAADRKSLQRTLRDARTNFERAAVRPENAGDAMAALDTGKRHLQKHIKRLQADARKLASAGESGRAEAKQLAANLLEGTQETTRKFLEDASVWGKAGDAQRRINAAWTAKLDPTVEANHGWRQMRRRVGTSYGGEPIYRLDENAVQAFMGKVGKKAGGQEYFDMARQLSADKELVDAIGVSLGKDSEAYQAFARAHREMTETLEQVKVRGGYANQLKLLQQASGGGAGNLGAAGVGYAIGGAPGAAIAGLLSNPAHMVRAAAAVEAMGKRVNERMNGHLGRMFSRFGAKAPRLPGQLARPIKATSKAARRAAVPAAVRVFQGRHKDRRQAYQARAREVLELASNQELRHQRFEAVGRSVPTAGMAAQLTLKHAQGLAFLRSKLPPMQNPNSLTPHLDPFVPSDAEVDKFSRYWSAVNDPMSVLEDLERGRATFEQVEALQAVYPGLYQRVRQKTLEYLASAKTRPPFEMRKQLDMLLQLGGRAEPSLSSGFLQRQQQRLQELQQQQPPQGRPTGATPNLSDRFESDLSLDELETA